MIQNSKSGAAILLAALTGIVLACLALWPRATPRDEPTLEISQAMLRLPGLIESPHEFKVLNCSWLSRDSEARPAIRVSPDGENWKAWQVVADHPHSATNELRRFGEILHFDQPMRFVQARDDVGAINSLDLTFVNPRAPQPSAGATVGAAGENGSVVKPPVVSRTEWGCPDGQGSRRTPSDSEVEFLIVHHTAGSNTSTNWAETVQAIWSFHTITRGWGDIGYNFLIDPDGVIYEGRSGGDDSVGAHFSCANGNTMGISMIGDFTNVEPTGAALDSLKHLLAWKACKEGIDPLVTGFHDGTQLTLDRISGHRDANPSQSPGACPSGTVCPGAMLYPMLPDVRTSVAAIIANGGIEIPELELADRAFHDTSGGGNSDGEINPGEPIRLDITLTNTGTGTADNLSATLSSQDPLVTLTDAQKTVPEIAPDASVSANGDFNFTVSHEAPDGHTLGFDLVVTDGTQEWQFGIALPVSAPPQLTINSITASPDAIHQGGATTVEYSLESDQAFAAEFSIALRGSDGAVIRDPNFDFTTGLSLGGQIKFRGLTIPADLPPDEYELMISVTESGEQPNLATVAFPAFLSVTAADLAFENWIGAFGLAPADSTPAADLDGDGIPNLIEFAFDLDPEKPATLPIRPHLVQIAGESFPAITFRSRVSAHLLLEVERSTAPSTWNVGAGAAIEFGQPAYHPDGTKTATFRSPETVAEEPEQFFRVRATVSE